MSLVELARFDNRIEAELARLNLEADGIDAVLFVVPYVYAYVSWVLPR